LASQRQPSILWIEEIDFIAKNKDLFYGLLSELDSFSSERSLVVATTNKLAETDKSLRRGGRLDIDIRMDMPTSEDRYAVIRAHLKATKVSQIEDE